MKRQFAVIGLGRFGSAVALTLADMGYQVMGIDRNEELVENIKDAITYAVTADIHDEKMLEALGIRNMDVVVVAIGNDLQASILVTLMLKQAGIPYVVVKAVNDLHGKVLERVGADKIVYPERDMGIRLAHYLGRANILDFIEISEEYSLVETRVPSKLAGSTLKETDLRARYGITVLAIKRGAQILVSPSANDRLQSEDVLILLGRTTALNHFMRKAE
ncbi:MAG: TrkA family potassium uptake protein [Syntrophomonadaceae bacterium]|nr:TrkA family potassium uptake protein [Syntrophomonadaceae bacterium]MDH7498058.1 TrkA family potassium uptake protein [Syntrophomonadaceae bacterium]